MNAADIDHARREQLEQRIADAEDDAHRARVELAELGWVAITLRWLRGIGLDEATVDDEKLWVGLEQCWHRAYVTVHALTVIEPHPR